MHSFSISEAIQYGWDKVRSNWIVVGYLLLAVFGAQVLNTVFVRAVDKEHFPIASLLIGLLVFIITLIFSVGLVRILLNIYENKKLAIQNLYEDYQLVPYYFLASLLYGVIVLVGFVFFIIPGIYLAIRLSMWQYFLVDKNVGVVGSLQKSWEVTGGNALNLLLLYIVEGFVIVLGILVFFIGVFVAIPVIYLANIYVYKELSKTSKSVKK